MPRWLDTRGKSTLGLGICARCSKKFSLDDLYSDPNFPGLRVCENDRDEYDPYRLPMRPSDQITLRFVRPDADLEVTGEMQLEDEYYYLLTEDGNHILL